MENPKKFAEIYLRYLPLFACMVSTLVKFTKDFILFQIHFNGTKSFIPFDAIILQLDDFDDSKNTID